MRTDTLTAIDDPTDPVAIDALLARLPLTGVLEAMPDAVAIYEQTGRLIFSNGAARALVNLASDTAFTLHPSPQLPEQVNARDESGAPVTLGESYLSRLLRGETIHSEHPVEARFVTRNDDERFLSVSGAPISDANGAVIGAIVIMRDMTDQRRHEQEQNALMLREREARAASERMAHELERVEVALDTALMRLSLDDLLRELLDRAREALKADTATLLLMNAEGDALTVRAARGLDDDNIHQARVPVGKGFAGRIAHTREPLFLPNTRQFEAVSEYLRENLRSVVGVPLLLGDQLLGVLHVGSITLREFSQSDIWLLQQIAERAALAIDRTQLYDTQRTAHAQAAAQARQLEIIIEALSEGVILYGPDRATLHANSAFHRMMGVTPQKDQLSGDFVTRGHMVAPRDIVGNPLPEEQWPAMRLLRGETIDSEHSQDVWLRSYDGRDALYSATGAPVFNERGEFTGAVMALRDVTTHRQLEREATARAAELEAIIETVVDGVFVHDANGRIVRVNGAGREYFGLGDEAPLNRLGPSALAALAGMPGPDTTDETPGISVARLATRLTMLDNDGHELSTDQWPATRVLHGETLTGTQAVELTVRLPDGQERLLSIGGAPMRNQAGRLLGAVMLARDVTTLHALQRRTQESLEALLEMSETAVTVAAPTQDDSSVRQVGTRLIELTRRVLGCQRIAISVIDRENGTMRALAVTGLTPGQERQWWAEQEEAERRGLRLDDWPEPDLVQQLQAGIPTPLDLRAERFRDAPNPYDITTMLLSPMVVAQQLVGIISLDYAGQAHDFTDEELTLASAVSKLAALVIERDRMLRQQAAAEAKTQALAQANLRMNEFLGIAAHELRTPITVIRANLQIMLRHAAQQAQQAGPAPSDSASQAAPARPSRDMELLHRTDRSLNRLTRLVDDLLDVSRVRAGKLELRLEPTNLAEVTRDTVEEQQLTMPDRRIELTTQRNATVLVDAARVGQVVTNYLTNALKYSAPTTPVRVRQWRDGRNGYVSVSDNGPGIPADELDNVWELFHRIPGIEVVSGSGIGLGLGLHLCKTIIERQGGEVGVTSVVGEGSTFWFSLPLYTEDA